MDKKKIWEGQNRIVSEGLEWLYAEPHQKDEAAEEEAYLLGKPVNKIDEKKDRFEAIQAPRQELISRFREDPLFVIKKLEHDQKKLMEKYNAIKSKSKESHKHDRYHKSHRHRDSSRESQADSAYDRGRGSRDKGVRDSDTSGRKYPQIPNKVNPLDYAFSVNDDIAPPEAIQATAREKAENQTKPGYYTKSYLKRRERGERDDSSDYRSKYEKLKEYGRDHLEKSIKRSKFTEEYGKRIEKEEERDLNANFSGELRNKMYSSYINKVERDRRG